MLKKLVLPLFIFAFVFAEALLAARAPAQAAAFDAKTLERMSTFISNFTEVGMYDLPDAQNLTDERYVHFGVMHEWINNHKRFKSANDGTASIEAPHIENAVMRYFGKKFTAHRSVGEHIAYNAKTKRYTVPIADGEGRTYARVTSAEKMQGGNIKMTGTLYYSYEEDEGFPSRWTFEAIARPHKWNGKDTWALLSIKRMHLHAEPVADLDLSAVWRDESCYLGVVGSDGTRLRIKFGDVKRISDAKYSAEGVLLIHGGGLQKFDCAITVDKAYLLTKESRAAMGDDGDDLTWAYDELSGQGFRVGTVSARMTIKFDGGEIAGAMTSTIVKRPGGGIEMETELGVADGWTNNEFLGTAKLGGADNGGAVATSTASGRESRSRSSLPCAFGLGRIPYDARSESVPGIDQGVGEFIPSEEYHDKGWRSRWDYIHLDSYDALAALGMIKDADPVDKSTVDPAELARAIDVINEEIYWYSEESYLK